MKTRIYFVTLIFFLLLIAGFSQESTNNVGGRRNPTITKAEIDEARYISQLLPDFSHDRTLPFTEMVTSGLQINLLYPQEYFHSPEYVNNLIEITEVNIFAVGEDKLLTTSNGDKLTPEIRNLLQHAELGSEFYFRVKYRYKMQANESQNALNRLQEWESNVTVVPEYEAQFPGGFLQVAPYLSESVMTKLQGKTTADKIQQAIVKFTIGVDGRVIGADISRSSTDPIIDRLLIEAALNMPVWNPAQDAFGRKVQQEFRILFGTGC